MTPSYTCFVNLKKRVMVHRLRVSLFNSTSITGCHNDGDNTEMLLGSIEEK